MSLLYPIDMPTKEAIESVAKALGNQPQGNAVRDHLLNARTKAQKNAQRLRKHCEELRASADECESAAAAEEAIAAQFDAAYSQMLHP